MLTPQAINHLQIQGSVPNKLKDASFSESSNLWHKHQHHKHFQDEKLATRYEYIKIGKTLGLETVRFISVMDGHLFYYNERKDSDYLGYCALENVYVQWFQLKSSRFLFLISNGTETSLFYFETAAFWIEQRQEIARYAIQVDFENHYEVIEEVGEGSFSKVFKVKDIKSHREFAAKVMDKWDKNQNSTKKILIQEKRILNLMWETGSTSKFKECYEMEGQYIFILQYLQGSELMSLIKHKIELDISQMKHILIDLLHILKDCHSRHIIHRDIKPQNIIINTKDLHPKLIDFGLSIIADQTVENNSFKRCGTMGYMAPEVISCDHQFSKPYTYKCDIFSFGIISHLILLGKNPLKGQTYEETRLLNQECKLQLDKEKIVKLYGQSCVTFLQRLLAVNPKARYSADQALNSQFLRECSDKEQSTSTIEEKKKRFEDD